MRPEHAARYPADWKEISWRIRRRLEKKTARGIVTDPGEG